MVICCDTSFLFSLYGNDVHTPRAIQWIGGQKSALTLTAFNRFELSNALRFAEFRQAIGPGNAAAFLSQFEADVTAGRVVIATVNLASVLAAASRLSELHTLTHGHRGFDILHVAAAIELGADVFLTFDQNQTRLAAAAGLKVAP